MISQEERKINRIRASKMIGSGNSVESVSNRFGMSIAWVLRACQEYGVASPGTLERVHFDKRQEKIAKYVASGKTVKEAVREFKVSEGQIRSACSRFDVVPEKPRQQVLFYIIGQLVNTDKSYGEIAKTYNVTRQRVHQVAKNLRGVKVKLRHKDQRRRVKILSAK